MIELGRLCFPHLYLRRSGQLDSRVDIACISFIHRHSFRGAIDNRDSVSIDFLKVFRHRVGLVGLDIAYCIFSSSNRVSPARTVRALLHLDIII